MNTELLIQYTQWCLYSAIFVISIYGYGALIWRCVPGATVTLLRWYPSLGFAFLMALGGVLSLLNVVSFTLLFVVMVIGCLVAFWDIQKRRALFSKLPSVYGLWIGLACLFVVEGFLLSGTAYNHHDDFHGYLVYPLRLLQTGTFPYDPYNYRFGTGVLGAHSFFLAMGLILGNLDFLKVFEYLVGVILILALLPNPQDKSSRLLIILASMILFLALPWSANLSSVWTSVALFLWMLQILFSIEPTSGGEARSRGAALGFGAAALLALKTSNLPGLTLLLIVGVFNNRRGSHIVFMGVGFWVAILAWLLVHDQASGTWLYPFLGQGTICEPYPVQSDSLRAGLVLTATILKTLLTHPLYLLLIVIALLLGMQRREERGRAVFLVFSALMVSWVMLMKMGVPIEGRSGHLRHALPFTMALLLWLLSRLVFSMPSRPIEKIGWALLGLLLCWLGTTKIQTLNAMSHNGNTRHSNPYFQTDTGRERALQMQQVIPRGQPLLVRSARPYHLNFERNPIWITDFPGLASPMTCPTWPMDASGFAAHFKAQGIRYIAYSHLNEGGFPKEFFSVNQEHPQAFFRLNAEKSFGFQDQLTRMMETFQHRYNDGVYVVLDLERPREVGP